MLPNITKIEFGSIVDLKVDYSRVFKNLSKGPRAFTRNDVLLYYDRFTLTYAFAYIFVSAYEINDSLD